VLARRQSLRLTGPSEAPQGLCLLSLAPLGWEIKRLFWALKIFAAAAAGMWHPFALPNENPCRTKIRRQSFWFEIILCCSEVRRRTIRDN